MRKVGGELTLGIDPELAHTHQMMQALQFWSLNEIKKLPMEQFHKKTKRFFGLVDGGLG